MTKKEALKTLIYEIEEECHCSYLEEEIKIAIKALKKQIAEKPILDKRKRIQCINGHNQPVQHYKYCPMCGQLMDWSEGKGD